MSVCATVDLRREARTMMITMAHSKRRDRQVADRSRNDTATRLES